MKDIVLTGASGGIGKATTIQFIQSNVKTLILSGRNSDNLKAVHKSLQRHHRYQQLRQTATEYDTNCDMQSIECGVGRPIRYGIPVSLPESGGRTRQQQGDILTIVLCGNDTRGGLPAHESQLFIVCRADQTDPSIYGFD